MLRQEAKSEKNQAAKAHYECAHSNRKQVTIINIHRRTHFNNSHPRGNDKENGLPSYKIPESKYIS